MIRLRPREGLLIGREGIEIRRQDRRIGHVQQRAGRGQPGVVAGVFVVAKVGSRRAGLAQGDVIRTKACQGPAAVGRGPLRVLVDRDFDLIQAELDAVAVAQFFCRALAYRVAGAVEKRAVGTEIMQFPVADAVDQSTVPFRQVTFGIGDDPFIVAAPADGKFAAAHLASFWRHVVGTADHDEL